MDHQLVASDAEDDKLQQVPSPVGAGKEVARRIVAQFDPGDGVSEGMSDVLVRHAVAPGLLVDLHTG